MPKLSEVSGDDYLNLPQLNRSEVNVLWADDFWDGYLSGLLEYHSGKYWFQMCKDFDSDDQLFYRRFLVIELSEEQLAEEQFWEDLFQEKVGIYPNKQPEEMWHEFYEPYKNRKPRDLSNNSVIGWFENPLS
jgi:hypothetical protein